ncbi:hypothetical protein RN001_006739 [Aquatica leii]|uniref:Major facilitator superfamily (MFS) profile domain-containing protein n=1 Tax=Aquatica leii TaxID=1421715 RepID=A0AAN7P8J9_9COLE|nr:hypothetical protein RN001_006739 [Aquatica leii]
MKCLQCAKANLNKLIMQWTWYKHSSIIHLENSISKPTKNKRKHLVPRSPHHEDLFCYAATQCRFSSADMTEDENVLDSILLEVGEFGKYQRRTCVLIFYAATVAYFSSVIYVFETKHVNYRCAISGCDSDSTTYKPSWWTNAIPSTNNEPTKCTRYQFVNNSIPDFCDDSDFDKSSLVKCKSFVYETNEISILHDFELQCEENMWKLTLVGSINSFGTLVGLPLTGIISDRFGRKTVLVCGLVLSGLIGLTRSFVSSYIIYAVLECLDAICGFGTFPAILILGVEFVGPKMRVIVSLLVSVFFAFGGVIEGSVAWIVQSWRTLLRILYPFSLLVVFHFWLLPESVRWLLAKNKFDKARKVLEHLAKVNGKSIKEESFKQLEAYTLKEDKLGNDYLTQFFSSTSLVLRLVNCSISWMFCTFLYNGLTVNSVKLSGNSYLDFILIMIVEILGSISYVMVDKIGRKKTLAGGFSLTAITCISSIFVPLEIYWLKLILYLFGKYGVSISIAVLYTLTSEIFPTPLRNTLLSTCSMFGALGAMAAPQMPLLEARWQPLPLLLFGCTSIIATIFVNT